MKKNFLLILLLNFYFSNAQPPGQWMWIGGSNTASASGNYGVQGVASATNTPPALYETCEWTDLTGNFWFFGGYDSFGDTYSDVWKYNPVTSQWTWMKGPGTANFNGVYGVQG